MHKILNLLFGCRHTRRTFPITPKPKKETVTLSDGSTTTMLFERGTYVVCLDCGREFTYDWKALKAVTQ